MKFGLFIGVILAIVLHGGFILFGGLLFVDAKPNHGTLQEVELLTDDDTAKDPEEKPVEDPEEKIDADEEPPPDASEIVKSLETPIIAEAPALDAASLAAIEAALSGAMGTAGDFAIGADLQGGGIIGGTGRADTLSERFDQAFSLSEIDQKPRPTFQSSPIYPSDMRGKKIEGVVNVIFVVDASGKVLSPRVEKSNNPSFEKPALDAVRKWKFEPAIKGGERVACRMRAPIRFPPN